MRGVGLSLKAVLMIFLTISLSFMTSNLSLVSAEEEQNVCCEQKTSGESCVYTAESNCADDSILASISCEQTAFCKAGCCISDVGKCSQGVAQATCNDLEGYSWQEGAACEVSACEKNCCVIAESQCAYTTEGNCEILIKDLEDIVLDLTEGTGFYENTYCSELSVNCGCTAHDTQACIDEDVYWFDSCGNQEEVAEDCDYTEGTWCGTDINGDVGCLSTACKNTFEGAYSIDESSRNTHDEKIGKRREHGESWCLYESPAGGWFDRPGSQHYRSFCYFGEEIIEPCEDFREKVCIQYPYTNGYEAGINALNTTSILSQSEQYKDSTLQNYNSKLTEAGSACIDNGVYQDLINANVTTVPLGGDFWSDGTALVDTCSTGNLACPVTFAKVDGLADWKCVYNCQCLTQEWADVAAGYCGSRGDCGAKFNIAGKYADTFYLTRSQNFVGDLTSKGSVENVSLSAPIEVAFDVGCEDYYEGEADDTGCVKDCGAEAGENSQCFFISKQSDGGEYDSQFISYDTSDHDDDRKKYLENNYGVYGGMIGFSQAVGTLIETQFGGYSTLEHILYANLAVTIGLGIYITLSFLVGAGSIAAGAGAISGVIGGLFSAAGVAATVPGVGWIVAAVIVIAAAIAYWITSGGDSVTVTISSNCQAWQAPAGTENCELCDIPISLGGLALDDGIGNILTGYECTEYKCKSLGSGCQYLSENQGTTRSKCVGIESNDVNHPVIEKYMVDVSDSTTEGLIDTDGYISTSVMIMLLHK